MRDLSLRSDIPLSVSLNACPLLRSDIPLSDPTFFRLFLKDLQTLDRGRPQSSVAIAAV